MQIGDKVIISGGSDINWIKGIKPYYISTTINNNVTKAYKSKEICTISDSKIGSDNCEIFDLLSSSGIKLYGFYAWELSLC